MKVATMNIAMPRFLATTLLGAALLAPALCAAQAKPAAAAADQDQVSALKAQNQALLEENIRLKVLLEKPRSKEEAFAMCMQAAKGANSPMAAESIGGHCDQLLKK